MPDGASPVPAADLLVAAVQDRIGRLADGNPFPLERFRFEGSRTDRLVRLGMRMPLQAPRTEQTHAGAIDPDGSTRCQDAAGADVYLKRICAEAVAHPATMKRVQDMVSADPRNAFVSLDDGVRIGIPAGRCHFHCQCQPCAGRGQLSCRNCGQTGRVPCSCGDGRLRCYHCDHGYVTYTEYYNNASVTKRKPCGSCNGTGKGLTCPACWGRAYVECNPCSGSGWVRCKPCASTGKLTVANVAELVVKPARTIRNANQLPKEFVAALQAMSFRELTAKHGTVERHGTEPENGAAAVQLDCRLSDVRVTAELTASETLEIGFPGRSWDFVAVGRTPCISKMTPFLDDLLYLLSASIEMAADGRQAAKAIALAKNSRMTASVLEAVAAKRGADDAALRLRWEHAVSEPFVSRVRRALDKAYEGVGAGAFRRCWLLLGAPALAASAAAFPCRFGRLASSAFPSLPALTGLGAGVLEAVASAVLGLLPVLAVALLARWTSTRAVRRVAGAESCRAPPQGWWLRGPLILATALLAAGLQLNVPGSGSHFASSGTATHLAWSGSIPPLAPQPGPTASSLSPSPLPPLAPEWPPTSLRGDPQVYMAQFCLAQLGLLKQQPDGVMNTATRYAMLRLDDFLPPGRRRPATNAEAALAASTALRGTFRLQRTAADNFVTAGMSNLARANLTGLDVEAIKASTYSAIREPGREILWKGRDGLHGGRVLAAVLPDGCADIDVEIRVRGAVERTGPTRACWSHGSLVRMDGR